MEDRIDVPIKDWEKLKTRLWQVKAVLAIVLCFNIGIGCINMRLQDELSARNAYLNGKYTFDERECARAMRAATESNLSDITGLANYGRVHFINEVHEYSPEVQKRAVEILSK